MIIEIPLDPFPAVRVNSKWWRFTPRALLYHDRVKELREVIWEKNKQILINAFLEWRVKSIQYFFQIPKSNKKVKEGDFKISTPDNDNIFKALTDCIFYKSWYNDCAIYRTPVQEKIRSKKWYYVIEIYETL